MDIFSSLVKQGVLTEQQALAALDQINQSNSSAEAALRSQGLSDETIRTALATYYDVEPFTIPDGFSIPQVVLDFVPESSAEHYQMVPLKREDDVLVVGVNNPEDLQLRKALNFISAKHSMPYHMVFMLQSDVQELLQSYQNLEGDVEVALESIESELDAEIAAGLEETLVAEQKEDSESKEEHIEEDAPVTKIVATILRYAVDGKASDIHIEPNEERVGVRFRADGALSTSLELPKNIHSAVVARVKILSSMRLDEKRKPQDGRFSADFSNRRIDFRVSVLPTNHGEKVVMRILDTGKGLLGLADSGISPHNLDIIKRIVNEPYGIILISGPTGSGKSTTLRGMMGVVDTATKNVMSLEDPVEYNMPGVSQSQMRPEIGYTFASGLRAALRQDPDIILVGEIRDRETAQLAIQAALTGHLVLSTIHTNSSIGVIPRLIDMGVEPYLIAPTLKMVVAQRLSRTLCDDTGIEQPINQKTIDKLKELKNTLPPKYHHRIPDGTTMMHPDPNPNCVTGYSGRTAITEVLEVTEEIQELILTNSAEEQFYKAARKNGFLSVEEDAMIRALKHQIPYEEMMHLVTQIGVDADIEESQQSVDNDTVDGGE